MRDEINYETWCDQIKALCPEVGIEYTEIQEQLLQLLWGEQKWPSAAILEIESTVKRWRKLKKYFG